MLQRRVVAPNIVSGSSIVDLVRDQPLAVCTDATLPIPSATVKIKELDGLRGLAISLVLLSHLSFPVPSVQKVASKGWMGVDLFFVLSGYLIAGILLRQREAPNYYRNFYARRTLRIFPAYYMVLIAAIGSSVSLGGADYSISPWWFVFFIGNFRQAAMYSWPAQAYFGPLWSLQVEEQFYLVFPFCVRNLSTRQLRALLVAVVFLVPALRSCIVWWGQTSPLLPFVLTICRADSLAMGALVALYASNWQRCKPGWWLDAVVALGVGVLLTVPCDPYGAFFECIGYTFVAIFFAIVLMWTLSRLRKPATVIFRCGPLPWLGVISYGLYLWHQFAYVRLGFEFHSVGLDTLIQFAKLGTAIVLGLASWHYIEKPFQQRKAQFQ